MKNTTMKFSNGKKLTSWPAVTLVKHEFAIDVTSTDGRKVSIIFRHNGITLIRGDDSCEVEHN